MIDFTAFKKDIEAFAHTHNLSQRRLSLFLGIENGSLRNLLKSDDCGLVLFVNICRACGFAPCDYIDCQPAAPDTVTLALAALNEKATRSQKERAAQILQTELAAKDDEINALKARLTALESSKT
jgi:hypothetical protein